MWLKLPLAGQSSDKNIEAASNNSAGLVATLGSFDGIHLGHQSLLSVVREQAAKSKLTPAIITFSPHPAKIIRGSAPKRLSKFRQNVELLALNQIRDIIVLRFTKELSEYEAKQFVDKLLIERFNVKHLVIGPYARIGKNRVGTTEWLCDYFDKLGLKTTVVQPFAVGPERVSSSLIRTIISEGDMKHAAQLLGRPFAISSHVIHGDGRGRKLEFPTANLKVADYVKPPYGVYFCKAVLQGVSYYALANFGIRPTFAGKAEVLEAYLIDYNGADFYGQRMDLEMLQKIRDEMRFDSSDHLRNQIKRDIEVAKELIEKKSTI